MITIYLNSESVRYNPKLESTLLNCYPVTIFFLKPSKSKKNSLILILLRVT